MEVVPARVQSEFWRDRRVLITGHSGFKGSWLTAYLSMMGARVTGVSLPPDTTPSLFETAAVEKLVQSSNVLDVRDARGLRSVVLAAEPEVVFHLAAQSLVRRGYRDPLGTFETNVIGTANLLEALRHSRSAKVAVMITTDKVYENSEGARPHREPDPLGGHDPYSASKAASEMVIQSYGRSYLAAQDIRVASARAGNVVGGGDWAQDRLVPDMVRAWIQGIPVRVRNPGAVRPWQHVLEPLTAYLILAQRLSGDCSATGAYNFGPALADAVPVRQVVDLARTCWGAGASVMFGADPEDPYEAEFLSLDGSKARATLGIKPRWNVDRAVEKTINWYVRFFSGTQALSLVQQDIDAFEASG